MSANPSTNYAFLQSSAEQLMRLGMLAKRYLADNPNTSVIKPPRFGELLAQQVALPATINLLQLDESYLIICPK